MRTLPLQVLRSAIILLVLAAVAGCGPLPDTITINIVEPTQDLDQIVQATFQAMTAQAGGSPASTPTPAALTGSISGQLNYPAESLPPLNVVAYQVGTSNYGIITTHAGQGTYQIDDLTPGTYHVVAYTVGGGGFPTGLAGGYTQAVPCGLSVSCTDHTLIDVTVTAGANASGADPADWYAPEGTFPPFPASSPAATFAATLPPAVADGSIAGTLTYPADALPAMAVIAYHVGGGPNDYYYVMTQQGQGSYQIDGIPPGAYQVVAYTIGGNGFPGGLAGGYTQATLCGYQVNCNDHALIEVTVNNAAVTSGINPGDFYAPAGSFPPYPLP